MASGGPAGPPPGYKWLFLLNSTTFHNGRHFKLSVPFAVPVNVRALRSVVSVELRLRPGLFVLRRFTAMYGNTRVYEVCDDNDCWCPITLLADEAGQAVHRATEVTHWDQGILYDDDMLLPFVAGRRNCFEIWPSG